METTATGIEARVIEDIAQRQAIGLVKYGMTVADNPLPLRAWLQHAFEEALDMAIYLKRAIAEIDTTSAIGAGRNLFYEGLFDGEDDKARMTRLAEAALQLRPVGIEPRESP